MTVFSAILQRKWCPSKKHFAELDLQHGGKTAGIDIDMKKLVEIASLSPYVLHRAAINMQLKWKQNKPSSSHIQDMKVGKTLQKKRHFSTRAQNEMAPI